MVSWMTLLQDLVACSYRDNRDNGLYYRDKGFCIIALFENEKRVWQKIVGMW